MSEVELPAGRLRIEARALVVHRIPTAAITSIAEAPALQELEATHITPVPHDGQDEAQLPQSRLLYDKVEATRHALVERLMGPRVQCCGCV